MPAKTSAYKLSYPLPGDKVSDYPTVAKQLAESIDSLFGDTRGKVNAAAKIHVVPYSGSASSSNFLNATVNFGKTFKKPPSVWAVNTGGNTLQLVRIYSVSTTSASVQFQTPDKSYLGAVSWNFFVMEA